MTDFNDLTKKIDYLVRINPATIHPPLSQLNKSSLKSSYKPISKEKARQDLLKLAPEEIEKLYDEEITRQAMRHEREEKERYFNQPSYNADFYYWGKQPYWTIDEGILLILGKDPRKIKWEDVRPLTNISAFVMKFEEIRELSKRYVACGQLSDSVTPGVFLAWAIKMDFKIPEKLHEIVDALGIQIADWQSRCKEALKLLELQEQLYNQAIDLLKNKDEVIDILKVEISIAKQDTDKLKDDLKETERQSLYKMIAAMAYDVYGYSHTDKKSKIPSEIADDVTEHLGEKIDPDTARKWLHAACDQYPKQT